MAQYFGSKPVFDWNPNGSAESGHDFINQIDEQKGKVSGKETQYQDYQANVNNAQQQYQDAYKNQQAYGDLYNQAKQSEGVDTAREQYQKSLNAVNATNTAMTNLPSTINAGSNVVLNASQRNAALGNQMNKYANTLGYWTNKNAADQSQYQTALGAAQSKAGQQMSQQQTNVAQAMTNYQAQMNQANELYNQLLNERNILRSIYGDMYDDEYKHRMQELEIWADNLQAETSRYAEQQANYRANLAKQASEYEKYVMKQKEEAKNDTSAKNASMADTLNDYYSRYMSELADLDRETGDFMSYVLGRNNMLNSTLGFNSTANQARALRNKGFAGYLAEQSPATYGIATSGDYADLLKYYGM